MSNTRLLVLMIAGLVALEGCAEPEGQSETPWSTKRSSVLGMDLHRPELIVRTPILRDTAFEVIQDASIELLLQAADAEDPLIRANAIEALHARPQYLEPVVREHLADENRGVRYVAAMTVGRMEMATLAPLLVPLLEDDSASVQAAAIYGLKRCGRRIDLSPLRTMLFSENPEVRANAAFILGELGNSSALGMLRAVAGRGMNRVLPARRKIVDLQIAEAMVKLGSESELQVIRAALFSPAEQGESIAIACQMCGSLKDGQALPNLLNLALRDGIHRQAAEVRMAAALAVGLIDPLRMPLEVPREYLSSSIPALRAQAVLTLGMSGRPDTLADISGLLSDHDPLVQVSAAGAILRIRGL